LHINKKLAKVKPKLTEASNKINLNKVYKELFLSLDFISVVEE
jgi:hypothetical protein